MAQCIYSSFNEGCLMFDRDAKGVEKERYLRDCFPEGMGYDKEGYCIVEDDPDPGYSCQAFQSADPDWEAEEF